ncbi:MAG TPA: glycosyltransferase [bacterium]|nr:glycosyltransferase [bacterium]
MPAKIKVLRLQHSFVEPTNHRILDELGAFPDLEIKALCPTWGIESGSRRDLKQSPRADLQTARTALTFHYSTTVYLEKLGAAMRNFKPDIIHIHDEPWSLTTGQTLALRRIYVPRAKVVFCSAQNIQKNYPFPFGRIERWNHAVASAGHGCCEGVREVVRAKGFKGPFEISPMGIDPELFEYKPHNGTIALCGAVIGYVGQIVEEKGVFTLLRAMSELGRGARAVFVGPGPDADRARALASQLSLSGNVVFVGAIPHSEVARAMSGFDILAVPSQTTPKWKEQFGRVIVEAMSRGVPVVGSSSGSIPEVAGDAGVIFPEGDSRALAAALATLIDNPKQLAEMSAAGRNRVLRLFTWRRAAQIHRDIYLRIM